MKGYCRNWEESSMFIQSERSKVPLSLSINIIPNLTHNVKLFSKFLFWRGGPYCRPPLIPAGLIAINLLIGKGIEPHPTDGHKTFLTTLRLMERPLSLTQPCREKWGGSQLLPPLSTYIISKTEPNVKLFSIFFSRTTERIVEPPAVSPLGLPFHSLEGLIQLLV